jgi:hypothetical protein
VLVVRALEILERAPAHLRGTDEVHLQGQHEQEIELDTPYELVLCRALASFDEMPLGFDEVVLADVELA